MPRLLTKYFQVPDANLAYIENGSGPVLLLLHGNSGSKKDLLRYQTEYFQDFHTYAIDSRCHGETISEIPVLSFDQFSDDLLSFCAGNSITSASVIGYSDGGNLSLFLAKKAPHIFKNIVAISPNYLANGVSDNFQSGVEKAARFLTWLGRLGLHTRRIVMRLQLMTTDIGLTDGDLGAISTEVTILHAEHDLIKPAHIEQMARLIPGCKVELIQDCTHLTIIHKPAAVAAMRRILTPTKVKIPA